MDWTHKSTLAAVCITASQNTFIVAPEDTIIIYEKHIIFMIAALNIAKIIVP